VLSTLVVNETLNKNSNQTNVTLLFMHRYETRIAQQKREFFDRGVQDLWSSKIIGRRRNKIVILLSQEGV